MTQKPPQIKALYINFVWNPSVSSHSWCMINRHIVTTIIILNGVSQRNAEKELLPFCIPPSCPGVFLDKCRDWGIFATHYVQHPSDPGNIKGLRVSMISTLSLKGRMENMRHWRSVGIRSDVDEKPGVISRLAFAAESVCFRWWQVPLLWCWQDASVQWACLHRPGVCSPRPHGTAGCCSWSSDWDQFKMFIYTPRFPSTEQLPQSGTPKFCTKPTTNTKSDFSKYKQAEQKQPLFLHFSEKDRIVLKICHFKHVNIFEYISIILYDNKSKIAQWCCALVLFF